MGPLLMYGVENHTLIGRCQEQELLVPVPHAQEDGVHFLISQSSKMMIARHFGVIFADNGTMKMMLIIIQEENW